MIPSHDENYYSANHLWSAAQKQIQLFSARNETVSFQLVLQGQTKGVSAAVTFDDTDNMEPEIEIFSIGYVKDKSGKLRPDPLLPVDSPVKIPSSAGPLSAQNYAALIVDIHIPKNTTPGIHKGVLTLTEGDKKLTIVIALQVWSFTLPDRLSFLPQMNGYGRVPEADYELEYYRLAQKHRTCLNILPYGWSGRIADNRAPEWDGNQFEWTEYDQRFAPLLDGSAFADLPRGAIPVEAFYLPLNENWPINIHKAFIGGYWIET
jgi:hypothetical protein